MLGHDAEQKGRSRPERATHALEHVGEMVHVLERAVRERGAERAGRHRRLMGGRHVHGAVDAGPIRGVGHARIHFHADHVPHVGPQEAEEGSVSAADVEHGLGQRTATVRGILPGPPRAHRRDVRVELAYGIVAREHIRRWQHLEPHGAGTAIRPAPSAVG